MVPGAICRTTIYPGGRWIIAAVGANLTTQVARTTTGINASTTKAVGAEENLQTVRLFQLWMVSPPPMPAQCNTRFVMVGFALPPLEGKLELANLNCVQYDTIYRGAIYWKFATRGMHACQRAMDT